MKIQSTASTLMLPQTQNKKNIGSTKNTEGDQKEIDKEIQSLQQRKVALSKEIDTIKNEFASPKPKEELIRPLKEQIQALDAQIKQKQMEKVKKQSENLKETSGSDSDKKSSFATRDIKDRNILTSGEEENKSPLEILNNFTTQTKAKNEGAIKSSSNTSDSNKLIAEKKRHKDAEDGIARYELMENGGSANPETDMLA